MFRFVTILGQHSDPTCLDALIDELDRQKPQRVFFSSNISGIKFKSIYKTPSEVLENTRHNDCVGLIVLVSDAYFDYLDTMAASEKEVLLDYIQKKGNIFCVRTSNTINERPEFNAIRSWYNAHIPEALALDLRAWLQQPSSTKSPPTEFHPDISAILKVAFGPSVSEFSGLVARPADRILYNLFRYDDNIMGSKNFVLYLHPNITISQTAKHFNDNYGQAVASHPLLIIVDPKRVANRETWARTIKAQIECTNCLFLDDFVQKRFALTLSPSLRPARKVISPRSRLVADESLIEDSFAYFEAFINRSMEDLPIVVIKGQGGIGKSTFSRQLQRRLADQSNRTNQITELIVLEASDVLQKVVENPDIVANFTLFNLLRSMFPTREMGALGEQEFAWIFDTGRISIVIDGVDEIIPRLTSDSSMSTLFASIVRYSNYLRRGKIILTCRSSSLLSDFAADAKLEEYDLLPFDDSQVAQFVEDRFPSIKSLQDKTYRFLKEIKLSAEDGILPFVLRIACDTVQNSIDSKEQHRIETSDVLSLKRKLDFVIYKVCEREEAKYEYSRFLGNNSVDIQCMFFIQLALVDAGQCTPARMEQFFKGISGEMDKSLLARLSDHPLLSVDPKISFAYDVIHDFFLTLGFFRGLAGFNMLRMEHVAGIADRCQLGSPFLQEVADRVESLSDEIVITSSDYVTDWLSDAQDNGRLDEYYRCSSAVFNVGLQFLSRKYRGDLQRSTEFLSNVYKRHSSDGEVLVGVALHNIPAASAVRFDFSGLLFDKASVFAYDDFMRCKFNPSTKFRNSRIRPSGSQARTTTAVRENFVDCNMEEAVSGLINKMIEKADYKIGDAVTQLQKYLRVFRLHGSFHSTRQIGTLTANFHSITGLNFREVSKICEEEKLVETHGANIWIVKEEIDNVEAFLQERIYRGRVQTSIEKLFQRIK